MRVRVCVGAKMGVIDAEGDRLSITRSSRSTSTSSLHSHTSTHTHARAPRTHRSDARSSASRIPEQPAIDLERKTSSLKHGRENTGRVRLSAQRRHEHGGSRGGQRLVNRQHVRTPCSSCEGCARTKPMHLTFWRGVRALVATAAGLSCARSVTVPQLCVNMVAVRVTPDPECQCPLKEPPGQAMGAWTRGWAAWHACGRAQPRVSLVVCAPVAVNPSHAPTVPVSGDAGGRLRGRLVRAWPRPRGTWKCVNVLLAGGRPPGWWRLALASIHTFWCWRRKPCEWRRRCHISTGGVASAGRKGWPQLQD